MTVISVILMVLGVLFLLYCLSILLFMGYGTKFFLMWGIGGAALVFFGYIVGSVNILQIIPKWLVATCLVLLAIGLGIFLIIEGLIFSTFSLQPEPGADYLIILGAQLKESGPSEVLKRRLNAALPYLKENEDTMVIVSGGQGIDEPMSEAQGMYDYLVTSGIDSSRILLEDQSENTYGNLKFSSGFLDKDSDKVVVVTNNFHMFRARGIAKKMGYENISGISASSNFGMLPNNMLREFFGVVKDFMVGNL